MRVIFTIGFLLCGGVFYIGCRSGYDDPSETQNNRYFEVFIVRDEFSRIAVRYSASGKFLQEGVNAPGFRYRDNDREYFGIAYIKGEEDVGENVLEYPAYARFFQGWNDERDEVDHFYFEAVVPVILKGLPEDIYVRTSQNTIVREDDLPYELSEGVLYWIEFHNGD